MKRLTLFGLAGLLAAAWASPTLAADLPRPAYKAPVYIAPAVFSWTEPPRVVRRLFGLSHAAIAGGSSIA
jgi:hypothetical protein